MDELLPLGGDFIAAIAALVVGLFGSLLPKSLALRPLAIAFLVGYAVELFFPGSIIPFIG
jgi:hypothetical protein